MNEQPKVYAAVFQWENSLGLRERVEYFCDKDLAVGCEDPNEYANDFLMEEGEWLNDVIEEEPITDSVEVIGILETALSYIRDVRESHSFPVDEIEQKLEKLLVSYVAVQG